MSSRSEGRPISDEADARACLAAMTASGTTLFAWARANGVVGLIRFGGLLLMLTPPPYPDLGVVEPFVNLTAIP